MQAKLEGSAFVPTHNFRIDHLYNNGSDFFTVELRRGWEYVLVSTCDRDCSDVDIKLYDENNNLIAEDNKADDLPVVRVTPRWTGRFRVQVRMHRCSVGPCYYGVGVFGK